jgi:multiple sugar transport system permease protein
MINYKLKKIILNISLYIIIIFLSIIWIFPIYWMFITSLKPEYETIAWPVKWIPYPPILENYLKILGNPVDTPVFLWFKNSLIAAFSYSFLGLTVSTLAAYAFSRMKFPGRDKYFWFLVSFMTIPGIIYLIPNYLTISTFGWVDDIKSIIFPGLASVWGIFMLRQYFITIPYELDESAKIDGANSFYILWKIIIPLSKPALLTLGFMNFLSNWNEYLWALICLSSPEKRTLPVGIVTLQGRYIHFYGTMMAGAFLVSFPAIILFVFIQRYYMRGVIMTGFGGR